VKKSSCENFSLKLSMRVEIETELLKKKILTVR
jgi:hypothetical protein